MRVIVIGTGTIGSAVKKALEEKGHDVVPVSRNSGEFRVDISDSERLKALFAFFRSVMSRATFEAPITLPLGSMIGDIVMERL